MLKHLEFTEPTDDGLRQRLHSLNGYEVTGAQEAEGGRLLVDLMSIDNETFTYEMLGTIAGLVTALRSVYAEGYGLVPRA
jgi:hypothetical protein